MERTLKVLNDLKREGAIEQYAIGGGIAGLFYMEPFLTYDLDVFVFLTEAPGRLMSLSSLYESLRRKGYPARGEHVMIEGVPVQFIPAYNDLVREAVEQAMRKWYQKIATRVLRLEHLLAIMLQTDRPKDKARMTQLLGQAKIDRGRFRRILERHGLLKKWNAYRRRFSWKVVAD